MIWAVHNADALLWLHDYRGEPFDAVITDPPYSSGGATRGDRSATPRAKYVNTDSPSKHLPDFAGDARDQRGYSLWVALWSAAALRHTRPGGTLHVFTDWRQLPATIDAVQAGGWCWRGIVPWNKTEATRPQLGRHRAQCEYVVFATNGPHTPWSGAPAAPGFYECSTPRERFHITEKPVPLLAELVALVPPEGRVLDPFVGSGTTGEAAVLAGRRFVGLEIVPEIAALARTRITAALSGSTLGAAQAGQLGLLGEVPT